MHPVEHMVAVTVPTRLDHAFAVIAPLSPHEIFRGFGPLPAVVRVEEQTGPWSVLGQVRHPHFGDGGSAVETLVGYEAPRYFAYTITNFTNALRFLTSGGLSEWWFREQEDGTTVVRWGYSFTPISGWARPVLWLIVRLFWSGYMRVALERAGEIAVERQAADAASA